MRRWARAEPRWGYRMEAGKLREEGWAVNFKRVHRLWKQAGVRVPTKMRKRGSLGSRKHGASRLRAERCNHVWSYNIIFDQTSDGRRLKWLPLVDEFSKENLALEVDRRLESGDVIAVLDKAVAQNTVRRSLFAPTKVRSLSPKRSAAGSKSADSKQRSFRPVHLGKTPTSKASIAACATNYSTSRKSDRWPRPNGWLRITAINTTTSARIPNWVTRPRRSLRPAVWLRSGLRPLLRLTTKPNLTTNQIFHKTWSKKRGQVRLLIKT